MTTIEFYQSTVDEWGWRMKHRGDTVLQGGDAYASEAKMRKDVTKKLNALCDAFDSKGELKVVSVDEAGKATKRDPIVRNGPPKPGP